MAGDLISLADFRQHPPKPVESLWGDKWIVHPSLVLLAAEPKTGKSILVMDMLAAIANPARKDFLNAPIGCESKSVLYLNEEVHQPGVYERMHKLWGEGGEWEGKYFINEIRGIRLDDLSRNRLLELVDDCGAQVVAVDPIARYHSWTEDNVHMGILLNEVMWPVVRSGRTVIMVHHFNKMQSMDTRHAWARVRGGTRLTADPDSIFSMVADDDGGMQVTLNAQLRHGPWDGPMTLYRHDKNDLRFHRTPYAGPDGAEHAADRPEKDEFLDRLAALHDGDRLKAIEHANVLLHAKRVRLVAGRVEMI